MSLFSRRRHSSFNPFARTRKCPSPVLPEIPNIMHDCQRNLSQLMGADKKQQNVGGQFEAHHHHHHHNQQDCKQKKQQQTQQQTQQQQQREEQYYQHDDDYCGLTRKILDSRIKLYGTQQADGAARGHQDTWKNSQGLRRNYSANRIHRSSSLTRQMEDLESAFQASRRRKSIQDGAKIAKSFDSGTGCCGVGGMGDPDGASDGTCSSQEPQIAVSDIIGSFGLFQMLVLLFSGLREGLVGYDALIMSVILQPESRFLCADNLAAQGLGAHPSNFEQVLKLENNLYQSNLSTASNDWNETAQCYRSLDGGKTTLLDEYSRPVQCERWLFANETAQTGPSLVAEWSLVCQHHWLVAFVESAFFFGLVTGNLVWGYYADKVGRRPAYLAAHTISLIFGTLAVFMPSIYLFALCRFLSAFGSIGYNIIYSIQVELIGIKHRSFSTTLNHLGWGLGVICIPLVDHLFDDYRPLVALAPVLSLIMYPWAFWLPESSRWLMANDRHEEAREELIRAAKFNGKIITPELEKKIFALEHRIRSERLAQRVACDDGSGEERRSYRLIFTTPTLVRDTLILSYAAFTGHLYYYLQTINFAYMKNLSTEANFISSGAGEWVSVLVGAILLKFFTRKTCMSLFLLIMAGSFILQSIIDSELLPQLDSTFVTTTNNGLGTVSSLLLVFVVLIVNQEVYPTVVRQTGASITNTIGESGSTLAPMLIQFSRIIGPWRANAIHAVFCAFGIVAVQFVSQTDDIELSDT